VLLVGALEGFSVTVVGLALSVGGKVGAFVGVPVGAPVGLGVGKTQEPVLPEKLQRFVFFGPFLRGQSVPLKQMTPGLVLRLLQIPPQSLSFSHVNPPSRQVLLRRTATEVECKKILKAIQAKTNKCYHVYVLTLPEPQRA